MNNDILNKYAGYYIGTDLMGNSLPIKSWTFENEADFYKSLEQGYTISEGSLIWIISDSAYYKVINGKLKQLYQASDTKPGGQGINIITVTSAINSLDTIIPEEDEHYLIKYENVPYIDTNKKIQYTTVFVEKIGDGTNSLKALTPISNITYGEGDGTAFSFLEEDLYELVDVGLETVRTSVSTAVGKGSFSGGRYNRVYGRETAAFNYNNQVFASQAFAINSGNKILEEAEGSFVFGHQNIAKGIYQTIGGSYSEVEENDSFVIGNGNSENDRRNAFKVKKNGDAIISGNVEAVGNIKTDGNVEAARVNVTGVNATNISVTNNLNVSNKVTSKEIEIKEKATFGAGIVATKHSNYGANSVTGSGSVAFGGNNKVYGEVSSAFHTSNTIPENLSQVFIAGHANVATGSHQAIFGTYANPLASDAFVIGNGNSSKKKNAFAVEKSGNIRIGGTSLTLGSTAITEEQLTGLLNGNSDNYVKNTDYATSTIGGVVKINNGLGASGLYIQPDGQLSIAEASFDDINNKESKMVITASNLEYAVKSVGDERYALEADVNRRTNEIEAIAKGRATGYVFNTIEDLDSWLENETNISKLNLGDNLYIRAKEVPDYWWDGTAKQQLETQKVDLAEYVKDTDYASVDKAGVVRVENGFNSGLDVRSDGSLMIFEALEDDLGSHYSAVITTKNLDKAVKFVGDGYYAKEDQVNEIEAIAKGRATGYVFDTLTDLDAWLSDIDNAAKLNLGDNLYIRATDVPDYWWDGKKKQQLETQKVDLAEYVKDTDYASVDKAGVVRVENVVWSGLWLTPDGYLSVEPAGEWEIDDRSSYCPITPRNLEYAVKSVGDGYYATEEQLGDISSALDAILAIQETIVGGAN